MLGSRMQQNNNCLFYVRVKLLTREINQNTGFTRMYFSFGMCLHIPFKIELFSSQQLISVNKKEMLLKKRRNPNIIFIIINPIQLYRARQNDLTHL